MKSENDLMRMISDAVTQRIRDKDVGWSKDGMELIGDLLFDEDPEED